MPVCHLFHLLHLPHLRHIRIKSVVQNQLMQGRL